MKFEGLNCGWLDCTRTKIKQSSKYGDHNGISSFQPFSIHLFTVLGVENILRLIIQENCRVFHSRQY